MNRILRRVLIRIPERWLHVLHREAHRAWLVRRPAGDWPAEEAALRRAEVRDALNRVSTAARSRVVEALEVELRERLEMVLLIETSPTGAASPVLRTYASLLGWLRTRWGRGPELLGACEACAGEGRGVYHLDRDGACACCGGAFQADVRLGRLALGDEAPVRPSERAAAAVRHA